MILKGIGRKPRPYRVTDKGSICELMQDYGDGQILVKVIVGRGATVDNMPKDIYKGSEFTVEKCYFIQYGFPSYYEKCNTGKG